MRYVNSTGAAQDWTTGVRVQYFIHLCVCVCDGESANRRDGARPEWFMIEPGDVYVCTYIYISSAAGRTRKGWWWWRWNRGSDAAAETRTDRRSRRFTLYYYIIFYINTPNENIIFVKCSKTSVGNCLDDILSA